MTRMTAALPLSGRVALMKSCDDVISLSLVPRPSHIEKCQNLLINDDDKNVVFSLLK